MRASLLKSEEVGESAVGFRDPFLGELPALDLVEDPSHLGAGLVVHDAWSTRVVAVLGRVGDGVAHPRQSALVDQVHDQLQLVQALEVRDLRLVTGRDERLEPRLDQRGRAAAQDRLLAEQIGLGLLLERGLEHAGARGTDAGRVRERALPGLPGRVLVHGDQRRRPDALLVRPAHQVAGPLRRDHRDVDALGRRDRPEVDVEPVREHQHVAGFEVRPDVVGVRLGLRRVGQDHHDDVGLAHGVGRVEHAQARVLGDLARLRAGTQTDADVVSGVPQVQRVRVSLAAEPEDRDLLPLRARPVGVLLVVDRRHGGRRPSFSSVAASPAQTRSDHTPPPSHASSPPAAFAAFSVRSRMPRFAARERDPARCGRAPRSRSLRAARAAPRACPASRSPRS